MPQKHLDHRLTEHGRKWAKQFRSHATGRCQAAGKPEATRDRTIFPTFSLLTRVPVSLSMC